MSSVSIPLKLKRQSFGETKRKGLWWIYPIMVFIALSAFVVYSTWAAFQGEYYSFGNYLSPFYSPEIFGNSPHAMFGEKPSWIPSWLPFSPALLILWAPAGFRFTCYYYRGAYYKAFWADPISCAVGEPRTGYRGERKFPLILQNIHRYFLYLALIFLIFLAHDAWKSFWFADGFGIGLGSIILTANVFFLAGYTFSCHSLRHLVGGRCDELANKPIQCAAYNACSSLNRRHMIFAWCSLFVVGFSDLYVRLLSMEKLTDWRIF
ncbi:hypothetical protein BH20ACI4_BH20ACI4_00520 [soil metagenome]